MIGNARAVQQSRWESFLAVIMINVDNDINAVMIGIMNKQCSKAFVKCFWH